MTVNETGRYIVKSFQQHDYIQIFYYKLSPMVDETFCQENHFFIVKDG